MAFVVEVRGEHGGRLAGFAVLAAYYQIPEGERVTVTTDVAWCRRCEAFALAERFTTADDVRRWVDAMFAARYSHERTQFIEDARRHHTERWLVDYAPWLNYLPHRRSPRRCLECGGADLLRYEQWAQWYDHPASPGKFILLSRGHMSNATYRLYDPEGLRIPALQTRRRFVPTTSARTRYFFRMTIPENTEFVAGWGTLSLVNAGLAQGKMRSGLLWWVFSLVLGPVATFLIVVLPPVDSKAA